MANGRTDDLRPLESSYHHEAIAPKPTGNQISSNIGSSPTQTVEPTLDRNGDDGEDIIYINGPRFWGIVAAYVSTFPGSCLFCLYLLAWYRRWLLYFSFHLVWRMGGGDWVEGRQRHASK